ncbi:hypothetical protein VK792_10350 [Mesobacterium sp. TK19101]|uniref:Secreted protein n=1 Tax=Mesobacterium hydrothermale TaxID=3111907 RepID=A0ABU6HH77_9RHOB|nr:hypothetical protein [Mesobacterium sp. TK19101]MEC3861686.1 hypothetical protein [Mesobacterium sp. TK19101]
MSGPVGKVKPGLGKPRDLRHSGPGSEAEDAMRQWILAGALVLPGLAVADEISGDWCGPEGGVITIRGDRVTSPGGTVTDGLYSRHRYEFLIPEGESDAGGWFVMRQVSEEQAVVRVDDGAAQTWTRCQGMS